MTGWSGIAVAAALLVVEARRGGLRWPRALLGGATFAAATPHLASGTLTAGIAIAAAILARRHPAIAAVAGAFAIAADPISGALALGVALAMPPRRGVAVAGGALAGGIALHSWLGATPEALGAWPWFCPPRRLGTAIPLAFVAIGAFGMAQAVRGRPATPWRRIAPLAAGIVVAWLGTWHPPKPPLYNLPSGLALWGIGAGLVGAALRGVPTSRELRMAIGLGLGALIVTAVRAHPLGPGFVCGQLLASAGVLWLLTLALVRLADALCKQVPVLDRAVDVALVLQLLWMVGFHQA